ncbi:hypothetical protein BGZ70_005220 [Mortierella alpina]|uniref:Uncharacterized protein n=1 Tax=Mortierella alpina TaxID=64518 RepID=A0A9P6J962_MORAP|nr:hypothetical protein BGZ70_005220 [Mortierella alpina]
MPSYHDHSGSRTGEFPPPIYAVAESDSDSDARSWSLFKGHRGQHRYGNDDPPPSKHWFDSMFPFHDRGRRGSSSSLFSIGGEHKKKKPWPIHPSSPLSTAAAPSPSSLSPDFTGYRNARFACSSPSLHQDSSPAPYTSPPPSPRVVPDAHRYHRRPSIQTTGAPLSKTCSRVMEDSASIKSTPLSADHTLKSYPKPLRQQTQAGPYCAPSALQQAQQGHEQELLLPPMSPAPQKDTFPSHNTLLEPVLKSTVLISDLPPYFAGDYFGRNCGRNEKYAMMRLVALREHQEALGCLLHQLPTCAQSLVQAQSDPRPNFLAKDQEFTIKITPEVSQPPTSLDREKASPEPGAEGPITIMVQAPLSSVNDGPGHTDAAASNALQEYRAALLELLDVDHNLAHYLSRFIRTTRKNRKCLEFILGTTELLPAVALPGRQTEGQEHSIPVGGPATASPLSQGSVRVLDPRPPHAKGQHVSMLPTASASSMHDVTSLSQNRLHHPGGSRMTVYQEFGTSKQQEAAFLDQDMPMPLPLQAPHRPRRQTHAPVLNQLDLFPPTPEGQSLMGNEGGPERMVRRPVRKSSMPFARLVQDDEQIHTFTGHHDPLSSSTSFSAKAFSSSSASAVAVQLTVPGSPTLDASSSSCLSSLGASKRLFQDYDEIEAATMMGYHLASLQKANRFVELFDQESLRAQRVLTRFEDARDAYESEVYGES